MGSPPAAGTALAPAGTAGSRSSTCGKGAAQHLERRGAPTDEDQP
jgi:hypothetical protein